MTPSTLTYSYETRTEIEIEMEMDEKEYSTKDLSSVTAGVAGGVDDIESTGSVSASEKALLRKLDLYTLPAISMLYLLSFLDRSNIGNAALFGLKTDLNLVGSQFNTALAVFYACYIIIEPPANAVMKRCQPNVWLAFLSLLTGAMCLSMGFTTNFSTLTAVRALLGVVEGGFYPGVMFYISQWYRRGEAAYRGCLLFCTASAAGAFGGLLARAIQLMDGAGGLEGWRWIFIIEGCISMAFAIGLYFFIADSPQTASFLTPAEKAIVIARLEEDNEHMPTGFKTRYIWQAVKSPLVWLMMFMEFGSLISVYAYSTFSPAIVNAMGFTAARSQLLTVPPYVLGCIATFGFGWWTDKAKVRYPFIVGLSLTACTGYIILVSTQVVAAQYIGCCLVCIGCLPIIPIEITWNGNQQGGSLKRAVAIAMQIGCANSGGTVASYSYLAKDSPKYIRGHAVCASFQGITLLFATLAALYIKRENRRRDQLYGSPKKILERMTPEEIVVEAEQGDNAKWWRYRL